jgi:hypothetical protein
MRSYMTGSLLTVVLSCCGGARAEHGATRASTESSAEDVMIADAARSGMDAENVFGPLDVGADYPSFVRLTDAPFLSLAHGNRWVHVYTNAIGADAYANDREIPVGTIIVKASWLDDQGRPSRRPGPIYVMEKRAAGYFPEHGDWYFAMHWSQPTGPAARRGPIYWRGKSSRVAFCYESCHDNYDRGLGGLVPSSLLPR